MLQRNWRCGCGFGAAVPVRMLGEVATCPKCGVQAAITMQNTHPSSATGSGTSVAAEATSQTKCARCGRKFRGDWDRHGRGDAVVCDVCARQAGNAPPSAAEAPKPGRDAPVPVTESGDTISADDWRELHGTLREKAFAEDPPRKWRGHLKLSAAILVTAALVAGAIAYLLQVTPESIDAYQSGGMRALRFVLVENFVWGLVVTFVSLYFVCWKLGRLPNDDVWANVVSIGMVSVLIGVLSMVGVNGYLMAMAMGISVLLIRQLYDFGFAEFIFYGVVSSLLHSVVLVITGIIEQAITR